MRTEMSSLTIERSRIVKTPFKLFASLYWRLSATLLLLLGVLAVVYVYITAFTADMYFQEATQRLNAMVAPYIVRETHPFVDGRIDKGALKRMFDAAMVLAKKHIQRLWYPEPGKGGDIASRSRFAISRCASSTCLGPSPSRRCWSASSGTTCWAIRCHSRHT